MACFAMRVSGGGSGSGASSTDIYPATSTALFPYGLLASTIVTRGFVTINEAPGGNTTSLFKFEPKNTTFSSYGYQKYQSDNDSPSAGDGMAIQVQSSGVTYYLRQILEMPTGGPGSYGKAEWIDSEGHTLLSLGGSASVGGVNLCLEDGTNCPPSASGGTTIWAKEDEVAVDNAVSTVNFTGGLNVTSSPSGQANVSVDFSSIPAASLQKLGSSTYSTIQDLANFSLSPGQSSGGLITDAGNLKVNVSSGSGFIKALDSNTTTNYFMVWASSSNIPIPANSTIYLGVKYNVGVPIVSTKATDTWDLDTEFPLGTVVADNVRIYIATLPWVAADNNANIIERFESLASVSRDNRQGGLVVSNTGTRNVSVTAGQLLARMSEFPVSAIDTSGAGKFDHYYRNGSGGWIIQRSSAQWNNTQYDDGTGTLASITALSYSSRWWYSMTDGSLAMLYGQNNSATLAAALNDGTPSSVPDRILRQGVLIGRFIIQASGSTPSVTQSAFGTAFTAASVTNFSDLAGTADISAQTNLAVTAPVTLSGDTVGLMAVSLSTGVTGSLPAASIAAGSLGPGVIASSLAIVGVSGTYGSATVSPTITFNAQGQVVSASSNTITATGDGNNFNNYTATKSLNMGSLGLSNIGTTSSTFNSGGGLVVNSSAVFSKGIYFANSVKTANYSVTSTDTIILASCTVSASITVTLNISSSVANQELTIIKVDGSTWPVLVTIDPSSVDFIESTRTFRINSQYQKVQLYAGITSLWLAPKGLPADFQYIPVSPNGGTDTAVALAGSSTAIVQSFNLSDYTTTTGIFIQVVNPPGKTLMNCAIYDARTLAQVAASTSMIVGTGLTLMPFATAAHLRPGSYYAAVESDNTTVTVTRCGSQSGFGSMVTTGTVYPLPAKLSNPPGNQTGNPWCMWLQTPDGMTR